MTYAVSDIVTMRAALTETQVQREILLSLALTSLGTTLDHRNQPANPRARYVKLAALALAQIEAIDQEGKEDA